MSFAHLHGHTTMSFLDGYGTAAQVAARVVELGHSACACTDHGNVICHVPYEKDMRKAGLKPIFGCEFYVVEDMSERSRPDPSKGVEGFPHVTILAINQVGYANLLALSTESWLEGFYYKPRLDWAAIARRQEGLVVLSGCVGGFPSQLCNNLGPEAAHSFIAERRSQIEHYYVELIPQPGLDICHSSFHHLAAIARDLNVPAVLTADAHFPRPEDWDAEDTMVCIATGKTRNATDRKIQLPNYQYYCTEDELLVRARDVMAGRGWDEAFYAQAIANSGIIADACNVEIPKAAPITYPGVNIDDTVAVLRTWCLEGLERRLNASPAVMSRREEYEARMERELKVVEAKGFAGYIMVLTDLAAWIKAQDGLVMCRGSAGGCLLLWLLGCSETDSIAHELSFERFYDEARTDPPDIDMDFEVSMKEKVYGYLSNKYGDKNCAQICAITLMRARNALADVASVNGIASADITALSTALDSKDDDVDKQLDNVTDPGALSVLKKWPVLRTVERIVGQARQQTVHAAGVLVSSRPIGESVGLMRPQGNQGKPVSTCDKHGAADLGFLKLDLLSVAAFDVTANAARRIGANTAFMYSLPLDDPKVYETARAHKVAGVFQIDGAASRVADQIGLEKFEELYAASALCRPGACDHVPLYVKNKYDKAAFSSYLASLHPLASSIVADTYGVLLYQEQVMRICRDCAQMPWSRVNKLRKRISAASFNGHELGAEYGDEFLAGCVANGMSAQEATYWWDAIKKHGVYCVSGDTIIDRGHSGINGGGKITIAEYFARTHEQEYFVRKERNNAIGLKYTSFASKFRAGKCSLLQMDTDGRIRPGKVKEIVYNGQAMTYTVQTADNRSIRITANHQMATQRGYVRCDELTLSDYLIVMADYEKTSVTSQSEHGQTPEYSYNLVIERSDGRCEACGTKRSRRFEVAHIEPFEEFNDYAAYHSMGNLKYLCNSCHKRLDYAKDERKKTWSKGRATYQTKIVAINPYDIEDTYCVVMATEGHNFIANDLVSHNSFNKSHCVTYGIVGYWMLWLKTYYPEAYYEAYLDWEGRSSSRSELLMKRLVSEYRSSGGKVELLDPTCSRVSFYSPEPGRIVGGWSNVAGIGLATAEKVAAAGPFRDWEHAREHVPQSVWYRLYECGATGQQGPDTQGLAELAPWLPVGSRGDQEKAYAVKRSCLECGPLSRMGKEDARGNVRVAGYVTAKQKKARTGAFKGEQTIYVLEDETGSVTMRVPTKSLGTLGARMKSLQMGDYVAVEGWWAGDVLFASNFDNPVRRPGNRRYEEIT